MRGRAFLGAFIALCLITGCASSSDSDGALEEALDRIESLEAQLSEIESTATTQTTTTQTTTTVPTVNLINLVRVLSTQVRESIGDSQREAWAENFRFSGDADGVVTQICYVRPYEGYAFVFYTRFFEQLGFSDGLDTRIRSTFRRRPYDGQYFEDYQNGFHIEWMADDFCSTPDTFAMRVWVTYKG